MRADFPTVEMGQRTVLVATSAERQLNLRFRTKSLQRGSRQFRARDRDRGKPRGSAPPTPPGIRVRTTAVREVRLALLDQGWETERSEVRIGKPNEESLGSGETPRAFAAASGVSRQLRGHPQCHQCRTATVIAPNSRLAIHHRWYRPPVAPLAAPSTGIKSP
jgi:hypothetical protein